MFKGSWQRLKLRTRIAAIMLVVALAVEALNVAVFILIPARLMKVYGAHWLVEKTELAALAIFEADAKSRDALSAQLGAANHLHISWQPARDEALQGADEFKRPYLERVRAAIEADLNGKIRKVSMRGFFGFAGNPFRVDLQFQPTDFVQGLSLRPLSPTDDDLALPAPFEYAIQGLDGSWVVIEPEGPQSYSARLLPWVIVLLGAVVLVAILSALVARRPLRALEQLSEAARDFGRTRKMVHVNAAGLREFGIIAEAMNNMQERIKLFIDERTRILAAMSHDLRTNLTASRLDAEELAACDAKDRVVASMEEMERMISATLTFAGDELKGEQMEPVDLAAMLISLCDNYSDRNYDACYDGPNHLSAICQPVAIKRAFTNLIDNALKYGGCARVQLSHSGRCAAILVADEGPGIPPEKAELAFQPFWRMDSARGRATGGAGLGLTISRDIIRTHGGEIKLGQPPRGTGLEVRISLPLPSPARA
jgi:signal transduction histidine kinase